MRAERSVHHVHLNCHTRFRRLVILPSEAMAVLSRAVLIVKNRRSWKQEEHDECGVYFFTQTSRGDAHLLGAGRLNNGLSTLAVFDDVWSIYTFHLSSFTSLKASLWVLRRTSLIVQDKPDFINENK
jgi:hypothetical protein